MNNINDTTSTIKDSIIFYTSNTTNCRILKILMDPFASLLLNLKKPNTNNQYNKGLMDFLENDIEVDDLFLDDTSLENIDNKFISNACDLDLYFHHLENLIEISYKNLHSQKQFPTKLYRSINKAEFDDLHESRTINSMWSTTKDLDSAIGFTLEQAEAEWNPTEHFIIELSIKGRLPFIDVDNDAFRVFEPNEVIIMSPFNVSKPVLYKDGGLDLLGFYNYDSIPIYKSVIKSINMTKRDISFQKIKELYNEVRVGIEVYGPKIEQFLNYKIDKKIFYDHDYRSWAMKLSFLIKLLKEYSNYCAYNNVETEKIINKESITNKIYKK